MLKKCKCEHELQDEFYGKQIRVFNKTTRGYRCTVCDRHIDDKEATKK